MNYQDINKDSVIEIFSGSLWEAEMVKSLLENAEIESFLQNATLAQYAYNPTTTQGSKVMILSNDYTRAKEVVDEYIRNMNKSL